MVVFTAMTAIFLSLILALKKKISLLIRIIFMISGNTSCVLKKIASLSSNDNYPKVIDGKRSCPIEVIGGAKYYQEAITRQFLWCYDMLEEVAESIEDKKFPDIDFDQVPSWYLHHNSEKFDKNSINKALSKLYQKNGDPDFWYTLGDYSEFFED